MEKKQITPNGFTPTLGSYSHGLVVPVGNANMIFLTGQIAMDSNGEAYAPNDAEKQTEFVFQNISKILEASDASIDDVVKVQIFLTNINDFAKVSKIRNKYFEKSKPASTLLEVSKLVKEGCVVEIEVMAIKKTAS